MAEIVPFLKRLSRAIILIQGCRSAGLLSKFRERLLKAVLKPAFEEASDIFGLFQFPRGGQYRGEHMAAARELKEVKNIARFFESRF